MGFFTGGGVRIKPSPGSRNVQEGSLCPHVTIKINFQNFYHYLSSLKCVSRSGPDDRPNQRTTTLLSVIGALVQHGSHERRLL